MDEFDGSQFHRALLPKPVDAVAIGIHLVSVQRRCDFLSEQAEACQEQDMTQNVSGKAHRRTGIRGFRNGPLLCNFPRESAV